jgi:hypothetical protein
VKGKMKKGGERRRRRRRRRRNNENVSDEKNDRDRHKKSETVVRQI